MSEAYNKYAHSMKNGYTDRMNDFRKDFVKYELIRKDIDKFKKIINDAALEMDFLSQDGQPNKDKKKMKKLESRISEAKEELRKKNDDLDHIEQARQSRLSKSALCRRIIESKLEAMKGYQFDILLNFIEYEIEVTQLLNQWERYFDSLFRPNLAAMSQQQSGVSSEPIVPDVNVPVQNTLINDENFLNSSLIENPSSGIGSDVLEEIRRNGNLMAPQLSSMEVLPSVTCGQEIQQAAHQIQLSLAVNKTEQQIVFEKSEQLEKEFEENEQRALVRNDERMRMLKKSEEEERKKIFENIERNSVEFQQKLRSQVDENAEKIREKQGKIDDYEKETRRLEDEDMKLFEDYTNTIVQCVLAQNRFEQKEKEWADWLKTLQNSIAKAKSQFSMLEICFLYRRTHELQREFQLVYLATHGAYNMIYKAWHVAKQYSEHYQDKIFLRILLVNFSTISDKLYAVLESLDSFEITSNDPIKPIRTAFFRVNAFDVYTTSKLRILSGTAKLENYSNNSEPKFYNKMQT